MQVCNGGHREIVEWVGMGHRWAWVGIEKLWSIWGKQCGNDSDKVCGHRELVERMWMVVRF